LKKGGVPPRPLAALESAGGVGTPGGARQWRRLPRRACSRSENRLSRSTVRRLLMPPPPPPLISSVSPSSNVPNGKGVAWIRGGAAHRCLCLDHGRRHWLDERSHGRRELAGPNAGTTPEICGTGARRHQSSALTRGSREHQPQRHRNTRCGGTRAYDSGGVIFETWCIRPRNVRLQVARRAVCAACK